MKTRYACPSTEARRSHFCFHAPRVNKEGLLLGRDDGAGSGGGIGRNRTIGDPDVDQRLHGLHVLFTEEAEQFGDADVVNETRVEVGPTIRVAATGDVPERVDPMGVVDVSVDTEDLAHDVFDVVVEVFGKADAFSNPVMTGKS